MTHASSSSLLRGLLALTLLPVTLLGAPGCGGDRHIVRGSQDPTVDGYALSTGLDKDDVQRALAKLLNDMRGSPLMNEWRTVQPPPLVAVFPFQNSTSEHIDSMLDAALGETETWLVNSGVVRMISRERQTQMIREVEGQQSAVFNPNHVAQYGRQMGAKYFITGKVAAADERNGDQRRVQYFVFMQVIEVETSAIRWQQKAYITKAIQ